MSPEDQAALLDPRPDLPGSRLWEILLELLASSRDNPRGLYGLIKGFRGAGCTLEWSDGSWVLTPVIDPTRQVSIFADWQEWVSEVNSWLAPHGDQVAAALSRLPGPAQVTDNTASAAVPPPDAWVP